MQKYSWMRAEDGMIGGVCKGLARQFDMDPWLMRLIWIAAVLFFGLGVGLYIVFWICLPRHDRMVAEGPQKMILGVCARLHKRGDIELGLARILAVLLFLGSGGAAIVGYIILYFILKDKESTYLSQ